ncbi:hypothetical protein DFH09DRAFT_1077620 [Mycena vulgaris]|nr:hypothetical protein DFH09DRAFT_1077620 [Mycena vulgaris]
MQEVPTTPKAKDKSAMATGITVARMVETSGARASRPRILAFRRKAHRAFTRWQVQAKHSKRSAQVNAPEQLTSFTLRRLTRNGRGIYTWGIGTTFGAAMTGVVLR